MIDWQPRETLVRDNKRKLLWVGYPVFAYWSDWCEFGQFVNGPGWQVFECEDPFYSIGIDDKDVTHWASMLTGPNNA